MREVFAHEATIVIEEPGDARAPGAAVTLALCGSWEHEPPCPLAPHHTSADRRGDTVRLRVLFAAAPEAEGDVRRRIDAALAQGMLEGPDGTTTRWRLLNTAPAHLTTEERPHAEHLRHA